MLELHETLHGSYDVCLWLVLAIVVFVVIAVMAVVHAHNQTKRQEKYNNQISGIIEEQEA